MCKCRGRLLQNWTSLGAEQGQDTLQSSLVCACSRSLHLNANNVAMNFWHQERAVFLSTAMHHRVAGTCFNPCYACYLASNHPDNLVTDPSQLSLPFWWSWHITTEMAFSRGEVFTSGVFLASFLTDIPKSVLSLSFSQFTELQLRFAVVFKQNLALLPVLLLKTNSIRILSAL